MICLRRLIVAIALALFSTVSASEPIWWASGNSVSRLDTATGALGRLVLPAEARAVAPSPKGGAWVVSGAELILVDDHLDADVVASVALEAVGNNVMLAAAADGGLWLAQENVLRRIDRTGTLLSKWQRSANILALAVAGPEAIWLADASGLHQYADDGTEVRSLQPLVTGTVRAMLLDALGGYLWLVTHNELLQVDALLHPTVLRRIALPVGTLSAAVDPKSGALWLLTEEQLVSYNRTASLVMSLPGPQTLVAPAMLALELDSNRAWVGSLLGTAVVHTDSMQWVTISGHESINAMASSYSQIEPSIELAGASLVHPAYVRFRIGANCNDVPCATDARYRRGIQIRASLGEQDVADRLVVDYTSGTVDFVEVEGPTNGSRPLRMGVTDAYGNQSPTLDVDVSALLSRPKARALPTTAITSPTNGAVFVAPATVAIAATASDSDGTITKVEFYRDAVLLGTDTTSPYTYSWANPAVGTYKLTVKAYDNAAGVTTSAIVNIQVKANVAPTVSLTSPANNAAYVAPASIVMNATAADSDGTVAKVEFYQGTTKLGTSTAAPYTFTWANVAGGTYSLTAKATDDKGAVATSGAVTVKVNKPPTVSLSAPADNTTLVVPASTTISATAADPDGTVSKVEFFRDGVLLGTDTSSPYSFAWNNIPIGTYSLTARVTDNLGATTTSVSRTLRVNANVAPTISLTSPVSGITVVAGVPIQLLAAAADVDGTISKVEFYIDNSISGGGLYGTDTTSPYALTVALSVGVNVVTAKVTDNKGATTTSSPVTVTAVPNQEPSVVITSPQAGRVYAGAARPDVTITATASDIDGSITNVKFYYLPSPTPIDPEPVRVQLASFSSPPYQYVWPSVPHTTGLCDENGCAPTDYTIFVVATDNAGASYEEASYIFVIDYPPWYGEMVIPPAGDTVTFNAPATVLLTAKVRPLAGGEGPIVGDDVVKVEFVAAGSVVATVVGPPNGATQSEYLALWRNVGAGTRQVIARVHDAAGYVVDSYATTVAVREQSTPPAVAVTSPASIQTFRTNAGYPPSIPIAATGSDADGQVTELKLLWDDAVLATANASTLAQVMSTASEGLHVVSALAKDNSGRTTTAVPVYVNVRSMPSIQAVAMTSPAPGAITNPVVLTAEVGASDGSIDRVHFFDGATLIGTATAAPYRISVSLSNGSHSLRALGVLYSNAQMYSTPVSVVVSGSNVAPTVALTSPSAGQSFPLGSTVSLTATAADADGSIASVQFYAGATLLATDIAPPYAATWTPTSTGTVSLTARATDNQGSTKTSAAVSVSIASNVPPVVSITAPTNGQTLYAGVPLTIVASATDADGSIAKVEFYAGGVLVGTDTTSPFSVAWTASGSGSVPLIAKAFDSSGAVTTSSTVSVTLSANGLPSVAIVTPGDGDRVLAGAPLTIIASVSDPEGSIARVEFYDGQSLLGTVTSAPFVFPIASVPAGSHALTAKVVDGRGAVASSSVVNVVASSLALEIVTPANGAALASDYVLVRGTYVAPSNSGITVNGIPAQTDGKGGFFVNGLPLRAASTTITAVLKTPQGQSLTVTRSVSSSGVAPFQIVVEPDAGMSSLTAVLRVRSRTSAQIVSVGFANFGSGVIDTSEYTPERIAKITFGSPGIYEPVITLTDATGAVYTQRVAVVVLDRLEVEAAAKRVWVDFVNILRMGNKEMAMSYLGESAKLRYSRVFDLLLPNITAVVAGWSVPQAGLVTSDFAELGVNKTIAGVNRIFLIYLMKDPDGIWRIEGM